MPRTAKVQSTETRVAGLMRVFSVHPDVYNPSDDSFLLAKHVAGFSRGRVLDMGTGCGIQALAAAEKADSVLAVDINAHAIECARKNAKACGLSNKIKFRKSDLFSDISPSEKFDLIIFNPPYLPTSPEEKTRGPLDAAWNGGKDGRKVIDCFLKQFARHLAEDGSLLLLHCDLAGTGKTIKFLEKAGFSISILGEKSVPGELLSVLLATKQPHLYSGTGRK